MNDKIIKANANGNTFTIIEDNNKEINKNQIQKYCREYKTDGLIILDLKNIIMDYYNNDGTWETFCLNGLSCIGLLLKNKFLDNIFNIKCGPKIYKVEILNKNLVKIKLPIPIYKSINISIESFEGYYIDSGAKHFVIELKNNWPNKKKLIEISKKIRYNNKLFPDGINVNFYKIINNDTIEVKTYEKGIEKLMSSCASGSYACAYHCYYNKKIKPNIKIVNPGGEFKISFNKDYTKNYITNKAKLEFSSLIDL